MIEKFPSIDYTDLISDINDDISEGYISEDDTLYIVRQAEPIYLNNVDKKIRAVIDYFYATPVLEQSLIPMTVRKAKDYCRESLAAEGISEGMTAVIETLRSDLTDYTKGNPKRNDRPCKLLVTEDGKLPVMVYFDNCDPGDTAEKIKVSDLLSELKECSAE